MSDVVDKWGRPVAERGFAQIPNYLLLLNQFLDREHRLSPVELLVLLQLVGSWWKKGDLPFPSMGTLATRCGVSDRQVQRSIGQLEQIGLLKRVNRRNKGIIASNAYDLTPLVEILEEVAKAFPNGFPRNVDKATVQAISSRLGETQETEAPVLPTPDAQVPTDALTQTEQPVRARPRRKPNKPKQAAPSGWSGIRDWGDDQ